MRYIENCEDADHIAIYLLFIKERMLFICKKHKVIKI